jgi:endonuclease YncB( thermonuclease family)
VPGTSCNSRHPLPGLSCMGRRADRYKRILGKVLVNGADAGLDQIETGMASPFSVAVAREIYNSNRPAPSEHDLGSWAPSCETES